MARILDLDKVVPDDITVVIRGREFKLPGDPPLETYFKLLAIQEKADALDPDDEDTDPRAVFDSIFDATYELFAVSQPDLERAELRGLIGMQSAMLVLNQVVSLYADAEEASNGARPTRTSSRASKRSASGRKPTSRS